MGLAVYIRLARNGSWYRLRSSGGAGQHDWRKVAKEEKIEMEGTVEDALPNAMFKVKLDDLPEDAAPVLGHIAGKMRRFRIRINPGDRVRVEVSPYDLTRGRIVYRHK